jgi:ribosome-associated protein
MNITKLQRVIVDALEDVKAQGIQVFNTTHLTALFDRVIIASGTSNRQTKALAASVRDEVKKAGGDVLSVEGEDVGEWVLVDCGDAVVHIMQPAIRLYYHLEDIWGGKPVNIKLGAEEAEEKRKVAVGVSAAPAASKTTPAKKVAAKTVAAKKAAVKSVAANKTAPARKAAPVKKAAPARKSAPRKTAS